jgi:hypothetical protein
MDNVQGKTVTTMHFCKELSEFNQRYTLENCSKSYIPMILVQHSTTFPDPLSPERLSATTMLATTGHDCLMNTSSTSRHEVILCSSVPAVKHTVEIGTPNKDLLPQIKQYLTFYAKLSAKD